MGVVVISVDEALTGWIVSSRASGLGVGDFFARTALQDTKPSITLAETIQCNHTVAVVRSGEKPTLNFICDLACLACVNNNSKSVVAAHKGPQNAIFPLLGVGIFWTFFNFMM